MLMTCIALVSEVDFARSICSFGPDGDRRLCHLPVWMELILPHLVQALGGERVMLELYERKYCPLSRTV